MRLLLLSDTHGKLSIINELAATVQADAVVHAGDFGFYDADSGERLSKRELRLLVRHSSVSPAEKKRAKGMSKGDLAVFVQEHKLLGDLQRYIEGEASFDVPIYAVWGNHEDKHVIEAFRDESYQVSNLHLLDERHVYHLGPFTFFGLGGNVLTGKKLFHDPIGGGGGKVWATLGQFGKLYQTLSEVSKDDEEVRLFVTHVSPGKEPLAALMGAQYRADFHVSGHMAPTHTMAWNNFAIRELEQAESWLIDSVAHIRLC
jgi:predicted phosphodiesterase